MSDPSNCPNCGHDDIMPVGNIWTCERCHAMFCVCIDSAYRVENSISKGCSE